MKVSLNLLKKYVDLPKNITDEQVAYDMTLRTVEVDEVENLYTTTDGNLYIYLQEGNATVEVIVNGKTYTGTVTVTPQNAEVFVLN